MTAYTVRAYAKINLYLDITGRRNDGYHEIETVMQEISLGDDLVITIGGAPGIELSCSDYSIPTDQRNLCWMAAWAFYNATKLPPTVNILLEKNIPHGAGLGGGSSDAAAVLRVLNLHYGCPLDEDALCRLATSLGADVPFFLNGGTQICRGIGEQMTSIEPFPEKYYAVVMPDFTCPTGLAYGLYDKAPLPVYGGLERMLTAGEDFPCRMYNVFQRLYADERIEEICKTLVTNGAEGAVLSGSGAAVFGVFGDKQKAQTAVGLCSGKMSGVFTPVSRISI